MSCNKRNFFWGGGQRGIRKCSCAWLGRNTHSPLTHILRFRHHCQPRTGKPALRPCSGKLALRAPLSPRRNPGRLHVSSPSLSAPRPAPPTASEALPPSLGRPPARPAGGANLLLSPPAPRGASPPCKGVSVARPHCSIRTPVAEAWTPTVRGRGAASGRTGRWEREPARLPLEGTRLHATRVTGRQVCVESVWVLGVLCQI